MMVLYRGVANPISGSILGADNELHFLHQVHQFLRLVVVNGMLLLVVEVQSLLPFLWDLVVKPISQKFDFRIKNVPPPQGQIRGENN